MRLAIATPLYPPESGGPATFAKTLEEELPARGWEGETVRFSSVRHFPKFIRHVVYFWHVFQAARRSDCVLALDPVSTGLPALLAARLAGKPFFVRIAGDYAWEQGTARFGVTDSLDTFTCKRQYPIFVRFLKGVQTFVAASASGIIVPSAYLAKVVHLWDIPREMMTVAYNAAPHVENGEASKEATSIVSVGRLVKWKGMTGVIRAFGKMRKEDAKLTLTIIGDGPERAALEALTKELELADAVTFTGTISREDVLARIKSASVFVLNTRYEGLSHLILEAFALGVPVATTRVGGNPELVEEGVTGLLFAPDDTRGMIESVSELMQNKKLRTKIVKEAKARADLFTKKRMIDSVLTSLTRTDTI